MFEIRLNQIGRRFNRDWIFRQIDYHFESGNRYAVLGPNGSGKSTLLKVISGSLTPSEGSISYFSKGLEMPVEHFYQHLTVAAPYMELVEEFSLKEISRFHFKNKDFLPGFDQESLAERVGLAESMDKPLRYFSSGMKQRVKLALACTSKSEVLLLDEPISNLDHRAIDWYHQLLEDTVGDRILIICSNQPEEYKNCGSFLHLGPDGPLAQSINV